MGLWNRHWMWDVMLFQLAQSTLVGVFQLLEHVELNMMEECEMIFGFGKDKDTITFTTAWPT